jgi:hypothetical protein
MKAAWVAKTWRPLVDAARLAGWREKQTRAGLTFYPPDGRPPITIHKSQPSDKRALKNTRADFRRSGLDV